MESEKAKNQTNTLTIKESRQILSDIARSDESSSSEKMKAIDLLVKIPDDVPDDREIVVTVNYGDQNVL